MNAKVFAALLFVATATLLGCSTPAPEQVVDIPPPEVQIDLPLERSPPSEMVVGRACQLGTSCLDLDPRPFEACLVGTKHCVDKALEPVTVQTPRVPHDAQSQTPDLQQIAR